MKWRAPLLLMLFPWFTAASQITLNVNFKRSLSSGEISPRRSGRHHSHFSKSTVFDRFTRHNLSKLCHLTYRRIVRQCAEIHPLSYQGKTRLVMLLPCLFVVLCSLSSLNTSLWLLCALFWPLLSHCGLFYDSLRLFCVSVVVLNIFV